MNQSEIEKEILAKTKISNVYFFNNSYRANRREVIDEFTQIKLETNQK